MASQPPGNSQFRYQEQMASDPSQSSTNLQRPTGCGISLAGWDRAVRDFSPEPANRAINGWYAEVADAVVCCHYDVTLSDGGVAPLSDFVLPHWFVIESSGPFDFINSPYIQHPLEVGPDGFKQRR